MKAKKVTMWDKMRKLRSTKTEVERVLKNMRLLSLPRKYPGKQPFNYYIAKDLKRIMTKAECKAFSSWMYGQTCPLIEEKGKKPVCGYYAWDVDRFFEVRYGGRVLWD